MAIATQQPTNTETPRDAALRYAALGHPVVLLQAGSKIPFGVSDLSVACGDVPPWLGRTA
jgi:hypothetical protein